MEELEWKKSDIQRFWGKIARHDHLVQVYENEKVFFETLEGYAGCGLLAGDSVVVIATQKHLDELHNRLSNQNFDLNKLVATKKYIPVESSTALSNFMKDGLPDEKLFHKFISSLIDQASKTGRHVRAFGEMVAELWQSGNFAATSKLESLWAGVQASKNFSLFCAYPKKCFQHVAKEKLTGICQLHTKVIDGKPKPSTEIYYTELN